MATLADDRCARVRQSDDITAGPARWRSTRFTLCYLACLGLCVMYFQRVSISLAIVCMVNHTALHLQKDSQSSEFTASNVTRLNITRSGSAETEDYSVVALNISRSSATRSREDRRCEVDEDDPVPNSKEDGPFVWEKETQGMLLAAIYVSYAIGQIPGSYVIRHFGVRLTVGVSFVVMSACHVLCHPAALLSPWAVAASRIVMGVCTALAMPAIFGMWTRWAPRAEQSQLMGITFSGPMVANASVFPLTALLCRYGFLGGWPSVFYAFGGVGLLWSVAWFLMMTDSPETHPRISAEERRFIVTTRVDVSHHQQQMVVPWREMCRSGSFWAIALTFLGYDWGYFMLMTNLPIYLYETMHFDIQSNGVYSMLPYLALFLVTSTGGFLTDAIIKKGWLSLVMVRKLFTAVPMCLAAVLLVVMSHLDCSQVVVVIVLLTVAVAVSGLIVSGGFFVNAYDIAPHFAVIIITISNTMSAVCGFLNPYLVAAITTNQTREEWQVVFYLTGGLYVAGSVVFCVLGSGQLQPWAVPRHLHAEMDVQQPWVQTEGDSEKQPAEVDTEEMPVSVT